MSLVLSCGFGRGGNSSSSGMGGSRWVELEVEGRPGGGAWGVEAVG